MTDLFKLGCDEQLKRNIAQAIVYYEGARIKGDRRAIFHLNNMYRYGQDSLVNVTRTVSWCRHVLLLPHLVVLNQEEAADLILFYNSVDHPIYHFNIGMVYYVRRNNKEAFKWFRKAAYEGYPPAQNFVGIFYREGYGIKKNLSTAYTWFVTAATVHKLSDAQFNLGLMFEKGNIPGGEINYSAAYEWYNLAADQGNTDALCGLALFYVTTRILSGTASKDDQKQARSWLELAASNGHIISQFDLANFLEIGLLNNGRKDYTQAFKYYLLAANQGYAKAQTMVGLYYETGRIGKSDYVEAHKWYTLAAEHSCPTAMYYIARLHELGLGTPINGKLAYYYYTRSASLGQLESKTKLAHYRSINRKIVRLLEEYICADHNEGISYLFFCNFIATLTKYLRTLNLDDNLYRSWITHYLTKYFTMINPNFDTTIIPTWFEDLLG